MSSIVKELADWVKANAARLAARGVQLTEKPSEPGSMHPWKASVAFLHDDILISFTVWERSLFQTELIVMNAKTGKTLVMHEKTPSSAPLIRADLDIVVQRLLDGSYRNAKPDSKLVIS